MKRYKQLIGYGSDRTQYYIFEDGTCWRLVTNSFGWKFEPLAPRTHHDGHIRYHLVKNGRQTDVYAHRLVYEYFVGEIPKGYVIHHLDCNRLNNNVTNLKMMTASEHQKLHRQLERR